MTENDISYKIRGAIFDVFNAFGPGLLESVYVTALALELKNQGLKVKREVPVPVYYKEGKLEIGFRLDLLIEVKSVEKLAKVHHKQVLI